MRRDWCKTEQSHRHWGRVGIDLGDNKTRVEFRQSELIQHLRDDLGTTVVMVSHELDSIFALADRLLFLDAQTRTMTALGPPRDLLREGPEGVQLFLRRGAAPEEKEHA